MIPVWLDDAKERSHDPRPRDGGPRRPILHPIEETVRTRVALERDYIKACLPAMASGDFTETDDLWARIQEWTH